MIDLEDVLLVLIRGNIYDEAGVWIIDFVRDFIRLETILSLV